MYIAVTGNIGSGKTSLTTRLGQQLNWQTEFEQAEQNPYLHDFYKDMKRWAFNVQVYFLNSRFEQVKRMKLATRPVVQDRSVYEDAHIFAQNLQDSGLMEPRDFQSYLTLYRNMLEYVPAPRLLVYLRADVDYLVQRIEKRGRDYEKDFPVEYLRDLNQLYENWIAGYNMSKVLVIEASKFDYVNNEADWEEIKKMVQREAGLLTNP